MKTILITGINGYLGSNLAKILSSSYKIIGLEYSLHNISRIVDFNFKVYSIENGILDEIFLDQTVDIIIHTATFYGRQNEPVKTLANANLFVPFDLLDKAIEYKCKVFINTDTVLDRFVSSYALTKRHFQEWLYLRRKEIKVVNIELEHFYGPGCSSTNFIAAMIDKMIRNESNIELTFGEQKRNFVYIDDILSAYKLIVDKIESILLNYSTFQIATDELITIKELLLYIKEITKSTSILNFGKIPYRENELMFSEIDNKKIKELGWESLISIKEGILKVVKHNNLK